LLARQPNYGAVGCVRGARGRGRPLPLRGKDFRFGDAVDELAGLTRRRGKAPPHCSVRATARVEHPNADPRRLWLRFARAACAAASTAATGSPMRSNCSDTEANSAASTSRRASTNRAARPARGPSTIESSSRNLGALVRSQNWVAVCRRTTSTANCPLAARIEYTVVDSTEIPTSHETYGFWRLPARPRRGRGQRPRGRLPPGPA
jgi:hypothetical protein